MRSIVCYLTIKMYPCNNLCHCVSSVDVSETRSYGRYSLRLPGSRQSGGGPPSRTTSLDVRLAAHFVHDPQNDERQLLEELEPYRGSVDALNIKPLNTDNCR